MPSVCLPYAEERTTTQMSNAEFANMQEYRRHERDTGSPEAQIAQLTSRIQHLTEHMQVHKKDFATQRGLLMLVGRRRRLLDYLQREDVSRYQQMIERLGLRR